MADAGQAYEELASDDIKSSVDELLIVLLVILRETLSQCYIHRKLMSFLAAAWEHAIMTARSFGFAAFVAHLRAFYLCVTSLWQAWL